MTDKNSLSRNQFLKVAGVTLAAGTLTCSGLGYAASRAPQIETHDYSFGKEDPMNTKVLVAYATRAGSTAEIATAIGETLSQRGFSVDVKALKNQPALEGYQAVVLGSAIRMGNWLPEAVEFAKNNQSALNAMPAALFTVHMLNTGDDETSVAAREAYLNSIRPILPNVQNVYFQGKMDFSRLSFLDRLISKMVKAVESDERDWEKIKQWSETVLS